MSEQKIRECIQETKEWKKDMNNYRDAKENIDLELVSVEIDAELKADLENTIGVGELLLDGGDDTDLTY